MKKVKKPLNTTIFIDPPKRCSSPITEKTITEILENKDLILKLVRVPEIISLETFLILETIFIHYTKSDTGSPRIHFDHFPRITHDTTRLQILSAKLFP